MKAGVPYDEMPFTFTTTDGELHSAIVRDLADGAAYCCCVKARDRVGRVNPDDYEITLAVADARPQPPCRIEISALDGNLVPPMSVVVDPGASQGKCVATSKLFEGSAAYTFAVPATGDYVIWTRIHSATFDQDSFFVSVDGGMEDVFDTAEEAWGPWRWAAVNGHDNREVLTSNPRVFTLSGGRHTVTFRGREPNTRLDRLIVTNDRGFAPRDR